MRITAFGPSITLAAIAIEIEPRSRDDVRFFS